MPPKHKPAQWQPIETAPKEGSPMILLYWRQFKAYYVGRWLKNAAIWSPQRAFDPMAGPPDDWMPLPEPPQ